MFARFTYLWLQNRRCHLRYRCLGMENINVGTRPLPRQLRYRCRLRCPGQHRHRDCGDTVALSTDESKRSCRVETTVSNAAPPPSALAISSRNSLGPSPAPPLTGRYRLEPVSLRFGVEHMAFRLCFGGGDAFGRNQLADYYLNGYWYDSAYLRVVYHGANSTVVILISGSPPPIPSSRPSSPSGTTVPPVVAVLLLHPPRALVPTTYAATPRLLCHPSTRSLPLLWDDSPHKCMFPGFLVVCRMNYGGSTTDARRRRRHRRHWRYSPPRSRLREWKSFWRKEAHFPRCAVVRYLRR